MAITSRYLNDLPVFGGIYIGSFGSCLPYMDDMLVVTGILKIVH